MPPRRRGRPRREDAPPGAGPDRGSVAPPTEPEMGQRVESVREGGGENVGNIPANQPVDPVAAGMQQLQRSVDTLIQLLARQQQSPGQVPEPTLPVPPPPVLPTDAHPVPSLPVRPDPVPFRAGPSTLPQQPLLVTALTLQRHELLVSLHDFRKLHPPTFTGVEPSPDPCGFIEESDRICTALGCSSERAVELVSFQMRDVAYT